MTETDISKCSTTKIGNHTLTISCNLGLWSVSGRCGFTVINEANYYFEQYKSDGEYSEILGGKSVLDIMKESR